MTKPKAKAVKIDNSNIDDDGQELNPTFSADAWQYLAPRLTAARKQRLEKAVAHRTRRVRLVIQDIHNAHNVSACLRSADAFGVQDVDIVTLSERFKISSVARGVGDWLTIRRHRSIAACAEALKADGYTICAGMPAQNSKSLFELPPTEKLAIIFGNEHAGVNAEWQPHTQHFFTIPMVGLVESLNISVCAAISLNHLTRNAHAALGAEAYYLNAGDQQVILNQWICRQIRSWQGELSHAKQLALTANTSG